jgi:hypothetical protein
MTASEVSIKDELVSLLADFGGQGRVLPRKYIELCDGDHVKAIFFSQLLYWSTKSDWFYKKYSDWFEELALTERQVRRVTEELKDDGILQTVLSKENGVPVLHYHVCREKLADWIVAKRSSPILQKEGVEPYKTEESYKETLDDLQEMTNIANTSVGSFLESALNSLSIRWVSERFKSHGRKLNSPEKRTLSEWLLELGSSEEDVECALGVYFEDPYWKEKNFPPDAFRKQFQKYLDQSKYGTFTTLPAPVDLPPPTLEPLTPTAPPLAPPAPRIDFLERWNQLVPAAPCPPFSPTKDRARIKRLDELAADPDFVTRFDEMAEIAQKILTARPETSKSWLTFWWTLDEKKGVQNWWKLLNDLRGLQIPEVSRSGQQPSAAEAVGQKMMRDIEKRRKEREEKEKQSGQS